MTKEEFDNTKWEAGMIVMYKGKETEVASKHFAAKGFIWLLNDENSGNFISAFYKDIFTKEEV
jgi:hypothetical protein